MGKSKIEWTEATWNPITGCTPISTGCANCYARRLMTRRGLGFEPTIHLNRFGLIPGKRSPKMVFVGSMGDLFHDSIPAATVCDVLDRIRTAHPQSVYQILTKRPDRLRKISLQHPWPANAWAGTTIECADVAADRLEHLRYANVPLRYLSCEPLLDDVAPALNDLMGIDWVICGGETGPEARPMAISWARNLLRLCRSRNVPFFFKHMGWRGHVKPRDPNLGLLDGEIIHEWPVVRD